MLVWLQVAVGGALGAVGRYGMTIWLGKKLDSAFPWGIFTANVLGCFLIGLLSAWMIQSHQLAQYRPLLIVGILGGFTTFSSFGLEAWQLIEAKAWKEASFYILGTNIAGLLAVFLGMNLSR